MTISESQSWIEGQLEVVLATAARLLVRGQNVTAASIVANAEVSVRHWDHDNWNGGQDTWRVDFAVPAEVYYDLEDRDDIQSTITRALAACYGGCFRQRLPASIHNYLSPAGPRLAAEGPTLPEWRGHQRTSPRFRRDRSRRDACPTVRPGCLGDRAGCAAAARGMTRPAEGSNPAPSSGESGANPSFRGESHRWSTNDLAMEQSDCEF